MSGYDCQNKHIFSLRWNTGNNEDAVMSPGRLFQRAGWP